MMKDAIKAIGIRATAPLLRYRGAPAERVVTRISEMVREPLRVEVRDFSGDFYIDPRSRVLARLLISGAYERGAVESAKRFVSGDVIDVGANVGFYSVALAKALNPGCQVVAIEPNGEVTSGRADRA